MRFEVRATSQDAMTEISSLERWFSLDADIAGRYAVERSTSTTPGEMSGAFDIIIAITSQAMTLGNLLIAYATWRQTRSAASGQIKATVEIHESIIEVSAMNEEKIRALVTEITSENDSK